jgi:multiple sugar transport system permease protein
MPLFLPFRKADSAEKAVQVFMIPLVLLGAFLVMVPFFLLLANSFGDPTDYYAGRNYPGSLNRYLGKDGFYVRYLHVRYDCYMGGILSHYYPEHWPQGGFISEVVQGVAMPAGNWKKQSEDAQECLKKAMPWSHYQILHGSWAWAAGSEISLAYSGETAAAWRRYLKNRYGTILNLNKEMGTGFINFEVVNVPETPLLGNGGGYMLGSAINKEFRSFLRESISPFLLSVQSGSVDFADYLSKLPEIGGDVAKMNALLGLTCSSWHDVALSETVPADPRQAKYWEDFVKVKSHPYYLMIADPASQAAAWNRFLVAKHGTIEAAMRAFGVAVLMPAPPSTAHGAEENQAFYYDWVEFARTLPAAALRANSSEAIWRRFLLEKYGSVEAAGKAHGMAWKDISEAQWPQPALDRQYWDGNRLRLAFNGLFQAYLRAWNLMVKATPAAANTGIYTLLFIALSLVTNTGIAYCLSRFRFPPLQMFLAYFLALTAFPIEAMAVPNFLVLRQMGLLNTIWALVLPTAVNGYFVYLLKTAFDAIPRSFFEEAQIWGASEWAMFRKIGLPMVKPMLAVVVIYSFLAAYSNFLWAVIVGQARDMWTLPVLVFTMRYWYPTPALISAALVLLVLPPMVVFLFANRTLQRAFTVRRM